MTTVGLDLGAGVQSLRVFCRSLVFQAKCACGPFGSRSYGEYTTSRSFFLKRRKIEDGILLSSLKLIDI